MATRLPDLITPFRFWSQKVLPTVYEDSLSYYEVLDKTVDKINEVINTVNGQTEHIQGWETDFTNTVREWETQVENALDDWKSGTETDITNRFNEIIAEIEDWEQEYTASMNEWKGTFEEEYADLKDEVEQIADDAESAKNAAAASATAAAGSATNAENSATEAEEIVASVSTTVNDVNSLKDAAKYAITYPESTSFINTDNDMIVKRFSDIKGLKRYVNTHLAVNSTTIISSDGRDIVIFNVPYYGFTFDLVGSVYVYILSQYSDGTIGSDVNIADTLTGTEIVGTRKRYTVNYGTNYYILIDLPTTYTGALIGDKMLSIPNLVTDKYQNSFERYKTNIESTNKFPFEITTYEGKLLTVTGEYTGGISNNVSYNTITFKAPMDITVTCTNAIRAVIDYVEPANVTTIAYNKEVIYGSAGARVESFNVPANMWVAFSFATNVTPDIRSNIISTFRLDELVSAPNLNLTPYQSNKALYKYSTSGSAKYIHMYYPCSNGKYVHYRLQNTPNPNRLVNTWQIGIISGCYYNGTEMIEELDIVENGEFESAIKEAFWDSEAGEFVAASDFNGGANHSCEDTTAFMLSVNGILINSIDSLPTTLTPFEQITAVNVNNLIRVDDHDVIYAEHEKRWTFDGHSAKFDQTITFKVGTYINGWECVMCKAIKNAVNKGTRRDKIGIENVGVVSSWVNVHTYGNEMSYKYYGDHATISVEGYCKPHEIDGPPNDHTSTGTVNKNVADIWISDQNKVIDGVNTPYYSKLYYDYWGDATITKPVQVSEGDTVYSGATYTVVYN